MLVLLVDDHPIVRRGLRDLLEEDYGDEIQFREAGNVDEVLSIEDLVDAELILLDLYMKGTVGLEALERVKQACDSKIVILSAVEDAGLIRSAIDQGAAGYIPKSSAEDLYIPAVKLVINGGIYLPPHVLEDYDERGGVESQPADEDSVKLRKLVGKKLEVLLKASEGKSNKIIASEMNIMEGTVKAHLAECNKLLGVHNRTAAAMALFDLLNVKDRADAIYAIASRASFDGQLKI